MFWGEGGVPAGFQTNCLLGFRPTVNEGAVKPLNWTSVGRKKGLMGIKLPRLSLWKGEQSGGKASRFYTVVSRV